MGAKALRHAPLHPVSHVHSGSVETLLSKQQHGVLLFLPLGQVLSDTMPPICRSHSGSVIWGALAYVGVGAPCRAGRCEEHGHVCFCILQVPGRELWCPGAGPAVQED